MTSTLLPRTRTAGGLSKAAALSVRPHQWLKNVLVFVPLMTSHRLTELPLLVPAAATAAAFCCCASSLYLINDLLDADADRQHPRKRLRPIASGDLPREAAIALSAILLAVAIGVAARVSAPVALLIGTYALVSFAYSARLKHEPVADVFVLAALYVLRVLAGGTATGVAISNWLLAFALFLFLSLAFTKRYVELEVSEASMAARGYASSDGKWMYSFGVNAGYIAVLVLALYVNSPEVSVLYRSPWVLWALCPLLLYWITRLWFRTTRHLVDDDPLIACLRDPASYAVGGAGAILLFLAI